MNYMKQEVWQECQRWGSHIFQAGPKKIDGARLLWAIAGCESSFGANCAPRHEPFWHDEAAKGTNPFLVKLTGLFGCDAHSSFGPWQTLLLNATGFAKPEQFAQIGFAAMQAACFINHRSITLERATTVEEIAAAYNAGRWKGYFDSTGLMLRADPAGIQRYVAEVAKYYDSEPVPDPPVPSPAAVAA